MPAGRHLLDTAHASAASGKPKASADANVKGDGLAAGSALTSNQ